MSAYLRVASDVGGTFTDLVYCSVDPATGKPGPIFTAKADTTPPDFEQGVMNALSKAGVDPAAMGFFAHGSTVVINTLTERKGVKTGLITTRGFRDVLEIARGNRPDLFNFNFRKPPPFVDRHLRLELDERVDHKGHRVRPPDLSALDPILAHFKAEGVQAIAISFLHAYLNPANEAMVAERVRALMPGVSVLASHEISREWREYERTSTVVLSAYVHPIADRYIGKLQGGLAEKGFTAKPYIMQSNGGIATVDAIRRNPITMVESGPASGIFAAAYLGRLIGEPNLIVLDIGGTTAKCTLIDGGEVKVGTEYHIERTRTHPGYPIQTPVSEIVEIGNGGGSIAWVDAGGKLHVGPQSAGARPGPAAYGRGGTKPTTTDANLLLGRIDPACFVGGEREPDWAAVHAAFDPVAEQLGIGRQDLARGIIRIANANMTNALRLVSTNRGHDPRDYALMAFGGGGAMHAVALAAELGVPRVIVPVNSSVFSSWGMLLTDLRRDYLQTALTPLTAEAGPAVAARFAELRERALGDFAADGVDVGSSPRHPRESRDSAKADGVNLDSPDSQSLPSPRKRGSRGDGHPGDGASGPWTPAFAGEAGRVQEERANAGTTPAFEYLADMRYAGQEHTVKVALTPTADGGFDLRAAADAFHAAHEKRFTYRLENAIQLVNFHLVARIPVPKPDLPEKPVTGADVATTRIGTRRVDFDQHGIHDAAIHDGLALEPGMEVAGPAIVQEPSVTLVVPPGAHVTIDKIGNYHVHLPRKEA